MCVLDGMLYAFGGIGLNTAECYDPSTNTWSNIAPMQSVRGYAKAAVIGGKIYVIGGADANGHALSSVECYDPVSNSWTYVESMGVARAYFGLAVL